MGRQLFNEGPYIDPPLASGTALVATTIEALWTAATFTPIFANEPKASRIYCLRAGGIMSTGASGTLIVSPLYGATTLGASVTQTVPINLTNVPWYLQFDLVFRVIGGAGANSTCIGTGIFQSAGTAGTAGTGLDIVFGGTSASVDATINSSLGVSKTLSVAGSVTTQYVFGFWRN
jgi:hypothetical protein